jgi:hypothetical protein
VTEFYGQINCTYVLKTDLLETGRLGKHGLYSFQDRGQMAGCCEHGNEISGCAHCEKFLEELRIYFLPQTDFTLALV